MLKYLLIELPRFDHWLDAQLALQRSNAALILAQRSASPPELGEGAHERAVHCFLQRIEREQLMRRANGCLEVSGVVLMREKFRQGMHGRCGSFGGPTAERKA